MTSAIPRSWVQIPFKPELFFRLSFRNCLSCVYKWDDHSLIHSFFRSSNIWIFIYSLSKSAMFDTLVTNILWVGLTSMVDDQSWFCLMPKYVLLIAGIVCSSLISSVFFCCRFLGMECCVSYMFPTMPNGLHKPAKSCVLRLKIKSWFCWFLLQWIHSNSVSTQIDSCVINMVLYNFTLANKY